MFDQENRKHFVRRRIELKFRASSNGDLLITRYIKEHSKWWSPSSMTVKRWAIWPSVWLLKLLTHINDVYNFLILIITYKRFFNEWRVGLTIRNHRNIPQWKNNKNEMASSLKIRIVIAFFQHAVVSNYLIFYFDRFVRTKT